MTNNLTTLERRVFRIEVMLYILMAKVGYEGLEKVLPVVTAMLG